ncbi:Hypothetical predicted protein [Marmota monax]|uniref:MROH2B-like HEAT-repeats domain-containing protein n=1 Tax=Marmota monax TaxID=9995 RepID=A0A5E4ATL0_MARMO|nr:Hypothetical predicted protein [Marmota monax]
MAFMKGVVQVTRAIRSIKDQEDFHFAQKPTLTRLVMAILKVEPTDHLASPVRTMAMDALSHLSKLRPFYSIEESKELMDISLHSVISLQPPGEDNESIKTLYANTLRSLEQLMESLMQRQLDPRGLQEMVHLLEKWILSEKEWEREKATNLHLHLMQIYVQSVGVCSRVPSTGFTLSSRHRAASGQPQIPLKLGQFGTLVGLIAPCTCDTHQRTRVASTNILSSLLDLHGMGRAGHEGRPLQANRQAAGGGSAAGLPWGSVTVCGVGGRQTGLPEESGGGQSAPRGHRRFQKERPRG